MAEEHHDALIIRKIEKSFGDASILKSVDLSIKKGEFIALVGPSGCGKSTLLRIVAGLECPNGGAILLDGRDVTARRAADRDMAMVFQSYALYPHLTARQNMALPLFMRRLSALERLPLIGRLRSREKRAGIAREVEQAATALKIEALLDRKPAQMSGGQRQRVALGRALVRHPKAFLMDEPLSNLDAALRVHMRSEIVELHRRAGVVTLYVTHDQEEALSMADRVAVMLEGRILQLASPADIYNDPDHIDVASFIGSPRINLLPAFMDSEGRACVAGKAFTPQGTLAPGTPVRVGVRPEHLDLSSEVRDWCFPVTVERVEFLGSEALVHCRGEGLAEPLIARLTPEVANRLTGRRKQLFASSESGRTLIFDEAGERVRQHAAAVAGISHAA